MELVRTPDSRFDGLADYSFKPHFADIDTGEGGTLRMHYVDEGPQDGETVLLLHGNPSWSYLYRHMIPVFVEAGYRVLAPDMFGFGKSDKPVERSAHTYANHVRWMTDWFDQMNVDCNLFCQDWGGLIGLRILARRPDRFRRVVAANTSLPEPFGKLEQAPAQRELYDSLPVIKAHEIRKHFVEKQAAPGFWYWCKFAAESPEFKLSLVLAADPGATQEYLTANEAPYPDETHMAALRKFPSMGPIFSDDPQLVENAKAWKVLEGFQRPFQTAWASDEFVSTPKDELGFQTRIPGAKGVEHFKHDRAGHYISTPAAAERMIEFMRAHPV